MSLYVTADGEMLDLILWRDKGSSVSVTQVLDANPHLADLGPIYEAGVAIILPDAMPPVRRGDVRLWGKT